jgi:hypothetical protein
MGHSIRKSKSDDADIKCIKGRESMKQGYSNVIQIKFLGSVLYLKGQIL